MACSVNLIVCLKRNPGNDGHVALSQRLEEISSGIGLSINVLWKDPMEAVNGIANARGVIVPNGSTQSFEGQVLCCKTARESGIPLLGICGGLQAAAVDVARHLAGLLEANSVEYVPKTRVPIIHEDGQLCVLTPRAIKLVPGRYLADLYGSERIEGTVRCGRFVNREYWPKLEQAGLELLATSADGKRILGFRLVNHPFYLGVAFLPQLNTTVRRSEPLLARFLHEAARVKRSV
jgi:CTP synthase